MARWGALPAVLGRIHPRFRTPSVSTLLMGGISAVWTVALLVVNPAKSVLGDSITALGFLIAFYYGMTGLACVVYFRHRLRGQARALVDLGMIPGLGALLLGAIFIKALTHYSQHTIGGQPVNYARPLAGVEVPVVIGIGSLLLGGVLMLLIAPAFRPYFHRRPEALPAAAEPAPIAEVSHA
jgi:amino acid transporter